MYRAPQKIHRTYFFNITFLYKRVFYQHFARVHVRRFDLKFNYRVQILKILKSIDFKSIKLRQAGIKNDIKRVITAQHNCSHFFFDLNIY